MGGINFQIDDAFGRKRNQRRETEGAAIAEKLMDDGRFEPAEINTIVNRYLKTGRFEVPTSRAKIGASPRMIQPDEIDSNSDLPERSTINNERIRLKKKKGLFLLDDKTNQLDDISGMTEGYDDVDVVRGHKKPAGGIGHSWKWDRGTGTREDLGPNGKSYDTYVYWNSKTGQGGTGGSGKEAPDVQLAKDAIRKYQSALLKGEEIPPEFMDSVRSASDLLGIDLAEVEEDPSVLDRIQNFASDASGGKVPESKPKFGGSAVRFNPKGGKPLTKEKAQQFLQQSGGDKDKARALAKQAGYTF